MSMDLGRIPKVMIAGCLLALQTTSVLGAPPAGQPTAAEKLNAVDAQTRLLLERTGNWDVVMTFKPTADAKAVITRGLIAERHMVGRFLAETMRPADGSEMPQFQRIAYLNYSAVEGRWQYVSIDTRFPVGIMPAYSFDGGEPDKVMLEFAPIGFVGVGEQLDGKMLRSNLVITHDGADHDKVQQLWI